MRKLRTAILAGAAALGFAGFSGLAAAQTPSPRATPHVIAVALPGGGVAQIRYYGEVPPQVTVGPAGIAAGWPATDWSSTAAFAPIPSLLGPAGSLSGPFAAMERLSAEMDRRTAALLREARALSAGGWANPAWANPAWAGAGQPTEAALRALPPGSRSYSFVATTSGNGVCTRSVEITSDGNGAAPKVVRRSSGDCAPAVGMGPANSAVPGVTAPPPAPQPGKRPDLLWTKNQQPAPYARLVRHAVER